jgi:hypothetical protein
MRLCFHLQRFCLDPREREGTGEGERDRSHPCKTGRSSHYMGPTARQRSPTAQKVEHQTQSLLARNQTDIPGASEPGQLIPFLPLRCFMRLWVSAWSGAQANSGSSAQDLSLDFCKASLPQRAQPRFPHSESLRLCGLQKRAGVGSLTYSGL